ncbi:hypothetical protein SAMN05421854_102226 [Amycolatopsis rubida]|uniref:Uncharacterized protein n=1 Tax=Amycolatopsis rubida TaxID=112413 RepID=A0A1I5I3H9_9PSEU|nr:hypothetical protein SAMN05421854_102226 [Amycolatopsis rubida]
MTTGVARVPIVLPGRRALPVLVADVDRAGPRCSAGADVVVQRSARAATRGEADALRAEWPGAIAAAVCWPGGAVWSVRRLAGIPAEAADLVEMALGACLVAVGAFEVGERGEDLGLEMR